MSCGACLGGNALIASSEGAMVGYNPSPSANGVYPLAQAPGCDRPYNGRKRTSTVIVIGMPSEASEERIFLRSQRHEALEYAAAAGLRVHVLPAQNLCHEIMLAFFGE